MLEFVETARQCDEVRAFCTDSFGVSIAALLNTYPPETDICRFWLQTENKKTTAVLCSNGGAMILCDCGADFDEIAEFLKIVGFSALLCKKRSAEALKYEIRNSGVVMQRLKEKNENSFDRPQITADFQSVFDLNVLEGDFAAWFADISRRIRTGSADMRVIKKDGRVVSTASDVSIANNKRVIGAVATYKNYRNSGFASALVDALSAGNTYLRCLPELTGFYKKLGFASVDEWAEI